LLAYVRHEARLDARQKDGATLRAHLEASARANGRPHHLLRGRPFPVSLSYLHTWWLELARVRGASMAGIAPITYLDVDAWSRQTDQSPLPHEVDAIIAIDAEWRVAVSADDEAPTEPPMCARRARGRRSR
jgi:hypothetical protein